MNVERDYDIGVLLIIFIVLITGIAQVCIFCDFLFLEETKIVKERAVVEQTCLFPFDYSLARVVVLTCSHGRISFRDEKLWSSVRQGEELAIYYSTVTNKISGKVVKYNHYADLNRQIECIGRYEK